MSCSETFLYADFGGVIFYSDNPLEPDSLLLARGPKEDLEPIVSVLARHARQSDDLLVPGIPEADTTPEVYAAAVRFMEAIHQRRYA